MATNVIKIKRSTGTSAPGSLNAGELAFTGGGGTAGNNGQRLFIGDPANSNAVTVIGGNYFAGLMDHAHGTTTASSALIVDSSSSTTQLRTPALYIGASGSDTLVSSTAAELNLLDGSSANSVVNSKAVIYGSSGEVAGTLSTAAQGSVTSLGTLTALTVDNLGINGNTITANSGAVNITPAGGSAIVLDGTINVDAGVVTGATSVTSTAFVGTLSTAAQANVTSLGTLTALTVDDVAINGKVVTMTGSTGDTAALTVGTNGTLAITTTDAAAAAANMTLTADGTWEAVGTTITLDSGGAINLEPAAGSAILLDGTISVDAGVVTGATSVTSTAFVGNITGDLTGTLQTAAQGTVTSLGTLTGLTVAGAIDLNATTLDIDASDDIDIDTSDTTGGIAIGTANSGVPVTLGHGTSEVTVGDNLTVTGNLTVSGTTTTVNSTTVTIADPIFEMGASGSDDNLDRGIKMKYNSGGAKLAFMGYDDSDGKFAFIPDATDSSSVFSGTQGTLKANIEAAATGIKVGDSTPFSDSSGTLTLQNIDALDATTEATIEAAIDTLSNLTAASSLVTVGTIGSGTWEGTTVAVGQGGTGLTASSTAGYVMTSTGSAFVMQAIDGGTFS